MLINLIGSIGIFCLGIAIGSIFSISLPMIAWVLLLSLVFIILFRFKKGSTISTKYYLKFGLILLFLGLGLLRVEVASWQFNQSSLEASLGQEVLIEGVVVREPDYRERSVHLYVETEEDLILVTTDRLTLVNYGDRVQAMGDIERPETFVTDLGRTFDYPKYLEVRGVEYVMSFVDIKIIESGGGNVVISFLLTTKEKFIETLKLIIPEPEVGLGQGLLLGVKSSLGEDIEEDFRRTGIIHIVVLSGYNVMLVVAFILFCFSFFMSLRWRLVAGIVAIVAFALIVGLSATVVRASIMACIVLYAQAFGKQYDVLRALFFAGFMMILINPFILLFDIGFQLSFMATLGLILIVPKFETSLLENKHVIQARDFMMATIATQIAVLPLLLYHIGEISLLAVIVNVLVLPMVPFAMLLTFLAGVIGFFSLTLASLVGFLASLTLTYILYVAELFGNMPFAAVAVPAFSPWLMLVMYTLLGFGFYYWRMKPKKVTTPMKGWTIVEEKETKPADLPVALSDKDKPADDIPVFFR